MSRGGKGKLRNPERDAEIFARYNSGTSIKVLAAEQGLTYQAIWYVIQKQKKLAAPIVDENQLELESV